MKTKLYDQVGREVGEVELADAVFGIEPRADVVHQRVVAQLAAKRAGTVKVKSRGEVRGGGRKPYRQKGTGHARQGSSRSPHFRGGGVVFGPVPRDHRQRFPRKMRRLALASALSDKAAAGSLKVVDRIACDEYKTRAVVDLLADMKLLDARVLFILDERNEKFVKSAANIPSVDIRGAANASVYEIVRADAVVITRAAAEQLARSFEK